MTKSLKIALALFLCLASLNIASAGNPIGEARKVEASDFYRHPQKGDKYNEMWSYVFVLDNGAKVYVNYTWMYLPAQGFKIGTDFSVWNLQGKSHSVARQYSTDKFIEDKSANSISINKGDYLMEKLPGVGHRVLFSANKNGEKFLDLTFTSVVSGQVPGDGVFDVNGAKIGMFVHIPYGRVKGRIGIGKDTIEVQGYGYMDHVWQTEKPTEMASRMITFSMPSAKSFAAGRIGVTKNGVPFGYAIYKSENDSKIIFANSVLENEKNYNPKSFPKNLTFVWSDTTVAPLKFETKANESFSILSNFDGFFERNAVKLALGELIYKRGRSATELGRIDWSIAGF
jgi:hypothetical protein